MTTFCIDGTKYTLAPLTEQAMACANEAYREAHATARAAGFPTLADTEAAWAASGKEATIAWLAGRLKAKGRQGDRHRQRHQELVAERVVGVTKTAEGLAANGWFDWLVAFGLHRAATGERVFASVEAYREHASERAPYRAAQLTNLALLEQDDHVRDAWPAGVRRLAGQLGPEGESRLRARLRAG